MSRSAYYWLGGLLIGLAVGVVALFGLPRSAGAAQLLGDLVRALPGGNANFSVLL